MKLRYFDDVDLILSVIVILFVAVGIACLLPDSQERELQNELSRCKKELTDCRQRIDDLVFMLDELLHPDHQRVAWELDYGF